MFDQTTSLRGKPAIPCKQEGDSCFRRNDGVNNSGLLRSARNDGKRIASGKLPLFRRGLGGGQTPKL